MPYARLFFDCLFDLVAAMLLFVFGLSCVCIVSVLRCASLFYFFGALLFVVVFHVLVSLLLVLCVSQLGLILCVPLIALGVCYLV